MSNKRGNIFGQGKPENPYEERESSPGEVPQRATAAQLATRKIKTAKARRPAGASSGLSQSANFGAPQASSFNFGASAPAPAENGANSFGFGGNNAFGGGATNSFPPAQPAAPSNNFTSSSFPAFGASTQTTGFNPQPPSAGFNFTAGGSSSNPFAAMSSAPATNGNTPAPAFGGSNMFNTQPQSNPFGGLGQPAASSAPVTNMFGTTTAAPPSNMFGTSSAAPSSNLFGTASSAPSSSNMFGTTSAAAPSSLFGTTSAAPATNNMFGTSSAAPSTSMFGTTTAAPAASATPAFTFSAGSTSTPSATSTPATTGMFSGFGATTQTAALAQNNLFSGFGQTKETKPETSAPQANLFGSIGQSTASTAAPAPALFNFGANAQKSDSATSAAPSTNLFGATSAGTANTSTPAPASNPFAKLPTTTSSESSLFRASTPPTQPQEKPTEAANLFSGMPRAEKSSSAGTETSKANPFAGLAKPAEPSKESSAPKPNLFASLKPAEQSKDAGADASKPNLFSSLAKPSTPAAAPSFSLFGNNKDKAVDSTEKPTSAGTGGQGAFNAFSTPQPSKTADVGKVNGGAFTTQPKPSTGIFSQTFQPEKASSNLFKPAAEPQAPLSDTPKSTAASPDLFSKTPSSNTTSSNLFAPKPAASTPSTQTLPTPLGTTPTTGAEITKIPKVHVPKDWAVPGAKHIQATGNVDQRILSLTAQLQSLNVRYREQLTALPAIADWSSVSIWHYKHATDIKQKIDTAKKERAGTKGVTGHETTVSKRKVAQEDSDLRETSPTKRARPAAATEAAKPISPVFPAPSMAPQPAKPAISGQSLSVGPTPTLDTPNGTSTAFSGFQPVFGGLKSTSTGSSANSGMDFLSQFKTGAKTYEQLAADRKAKAKQDDYDSDEETEEEWSRKYDEKEKKRLEKEKQELAAAPAFSVGGSSKSSESGTPPSNLFGGLAKPSSGTLTAGAFSPRAASPALSTNGSVFDAPSTAHTPSSNIFGHLSGAPSPHEQDDSDEDDAHAKSQKAAPKDSAQPTTPPKGSLLSRMSRPDDADAEKETEKEKESIGFKFGQTNGTTTPVGKPFAQFDFAAAGSKTAPPKSDTFAGDQTFKPGTPIKFGQAPATEKKGPAPAFSFQPPTPSASEISSTPAKPPPSQLFNFSQSTSGSSLFPPGAGLSAGNSIPSSVFSSRAGTPLSEADNSAASGAEDEEEGGKQAQVDFTQLTEDELKENEVVFHTDMALAKYHGVKGDGAKDWHTLGKGPVWLLKNKTTGKCLVRMRIPNGSTPVNYQLLPKLKTTLVGSSKKQVMAMRPAQEGGLQQVLYALKSPDIAAEFSTKYNESLPSA